MRKLLLLLLIGLILLTSCKSNEVLKEPTLVTFVVSDADAMDMGVLEDNEVEEKSFHIFILDEYDSYDGWYIQSLERRQMLRDFRNDFWQSKDDFEFLKRNQFKNIRSIIDGEMIIGYIVGADLDKTYEESLVEPDVKSDSIYATSSGAGGGYS